MKSQTLTNLVSSPARYRPPVFPFTALVGQELMKKALILNAINRQLCGVLIRGDKGTAKSTAVRGLAALLPQVAEVADCFFRCDPEEPGWMCSRCRERAAAGESLPVALAQVRVVDLPLNTTEDRLVGSLDFEHALQTGAKRFQPGVLAEANRGIIYIDEVNLLEDHLVDIILDTAVTGINLVEREGVSFIHPARSILIATMNPEEGDIRPQLLDRFGLCVSIEGIFSPEARAEIARRREAFDLDARAFLEQWSPAESHLRARIRAAEERLPRVRLGEDLLQEISRIAAAHHVAGHRADIMMEKTARTLAAFYGREFVIGEDLIEAAELVLPHRARSAEEAAKNGEQPTPEEGESGESGQPEDRAGEGRQQQQPGQEDSQFEGTPAQQAAHEGKKAEAQQIPQPGNAEEIGGGDQAAFRRGCSRSASWSTSPPMISVLPGTASSAVRAAGGPPPPPTTRPAATCAPPRSARTTTWPLTPPCARPRLINAGGRPAIWRSRSRSRTSGRRCGRRRPRTCSSSWWTRAGAWAPG